MRRKHGWFQIRDKMNPQFELAEKQRYECLKGAYKIIDQFLMPSGTPSLLNKHDEVKNYLLKMYEPDKDNFYMKLDKDNQANNFSI